MVRHHAPFDDGRARLIVEIGVPTKPGKEATLKLLADSRNKFKGEKRTSDN